MESINQAEGGALKIVNTVKDFLDLCTLSSTAEVIYVDIESTGLDPYTCKLLLLQLRLNGESYVVDFTKVSIEYLKCLKPAFENPAITKVFHNATFDWRFIYHHGGIHAENVYCTMVTEQLLKAGYRGVSCRLAAVAVRRLGVSLDKSVRDGFIGKQDAMFSNEELEYAVRDVDVLEPIRDQQLKELEEEQLGQVHDLEMKLLHVTALMEYAGIDVDLEKLQEAIPIFRDVLKKADRAIQDAVINSGLAKQIVFDRDGYTAVNTASPQQMLSILHAMDIEVESLSVKELTDWDYKWADKSKRYNNIPDQLSLAIEEFSDEEMNIGYHHPFLRQHAVRTAVEKILNTYLIGLVEKVNPATGRVHPGFKQCGAMATGRYSSSSPNFQNLPNTGKLKNLGLERYDVRSMFLAGEGNDLIIADYSAIELVILAALSQDEILIEQIQHGDVHTFVANRLFGTNFTKKMADEEPYKTLRHASKTMTYAICYGTGGRNLYRTLSLPLSIAGVNMVPEDGDRWISTWKETFPKTGATLDASGQMAVTKLYTESIIGRRRHWNYDMLRTKYDMYRAMREGTNARIQSSAADMMKLALLNMSRDIDPKEAQIIAAVHDEALVRSKQQFTQKYIPIIKWHMEEAGNSLFPMLPKGMISTQPKVSSRYDK